MRVSRSRVGAVAAFLLLAFALPASAVWTGVKETTVSCDGLTIKVGTTVDHAAYGDFKIDQLETDPASTTWAIACVTGDVSRCLTWKPVSDGGTAVWTGVLASSYTTYFYRSGSANCNGWLPGHGNYLLKYRVWY